MAEDDNKPTLIRLEEAQELVKTISGAEFNDMLEVVLNKMCGSSATGKNQALLAAFTREQTDRLASFFRQFEDELLDIGIKEKDDFDSFLYAMLMFSEVFGLRQSFALGVLGEKSHDISILSSPTNESASGAVSNKLDIEIFGETQQNNEHQSDDMVVDTQTKPLDATAVPFTPKGKNRTVTFADVVKRKPDDDSRPSSPTPIGSSKKPKKNVIKKIPDNSNKASESRDKKKKKLQHHVPEKRISTIMTGYEPVLKDNVREIVVYDIPSKWTQLEILNYLKAWGNVLAMKLKTQKKYVTVTVSIDLNDTAMGQWNNGVWTAPLGGLPVRWFPAAWDLKQRKEREKFQAVIFDTPKSLTTGFLYPADNPAQSLLSAIGCKAFKLIQDKGRAKLITYYESWADLDKVVNTKFNFEEFVGVWIRYFAPKLNRPRRSPNHKDQQQKQNQVTNPNVAQDKLMGNKKEGKSFGNNNNTKYQKKVKKDFDNTSKLTLLAEIKNLLNRIAN